MNNDAIQISSGSLRPMVMVLACVSSKCSQILVWWRAVEQLLDIFKNLTMSTDQYFNLYLNDKLLAPMACHSTSLLMSPSRYATAVDIIKFLPLGKKKPQVAY
jgi:hypothetical protein